MFPSAGSVCDTYWSCLRFGSIQLACLALWPDRLAFFLLPEAFNSATSRIGVKGFGMAAHGKKHVSPQFFSRVVYELICEAVMQVHVLFLLVISTLVMIISSSLLRVGCSHFVSIQSQTLIRIHCWCLCKHLFFFSATVVFTISQKPLMPAVSSLNYCHVSSVNTMLRRWADVSFWQRQLIDVLVKTVCQWHDQWPKRISVSHTLS